MSSTPSRRTTVEVTVDAELLERARRSGLDLGQALQSGIERAVGPVDVEERRRQWLEENAEAIESSNRYVEQHGLPLARYRMF